MKAELDFLSSVVSIMIHFQCSGTPVSHPDVILWKDLVELGKSEEEDLLVDRQQQMAVNQVSSTL
jgi:hypothetical protein